MKEKSVDLRILRDEFSKEAAIAGAVISTVFESSAPFAKEPSGSQTMDIVGKTFFYGTAVILTGREIYLRRKEKDK